jgi:hypothetical protein
MRLRSIGALVLVCCTVIGLGATSASATDVADAESDLVVGEGEDGAVILRTPDAPSEAEVAAEDSGMGIAAAGPATAPGPERLYYRSSSSVYSCPQGYFCASVWDTNRDAWAIFQFFTCTARRLYRWDGTGYFYNNQTGGAVARFQNYFRNTIQTVRAGRYDNRNWYPVWFIDPC